MSKVLARTGIRQPWMPAPLQDAPARMVRAAVTIVVGASIALPGASVWMPRPFRTDPDRLAPITVQTNTPAWPGARTVFLSGAARTGPDRLAPLVLQVTQPPWPGALTLLTKGARTVEADTLRAIRVLVGATYQTPAQALWLRSPDDTPDRLAPLIVQVNQPPQPGALFTLLAGATRIEADTSRPITQILGAVYQQPGLALWLRSVKDEVAAQPDRLAPLVIVVGAQYYQRGNLWLPTSTRTDPERSYPALIVQATASFTPAQVTWLRSLRTDPERLARLLVAVGAQYPTDAITVWLRSAHTPLDLLVLARIVRVPAADRAALLVDADRHAIVDGSRTATLDAADRSASIGGSRTVIVPEDDE